MTRSLTLACLTISTLFPFASQAETFEITEDDQQINIVTPELEAAIRKKGYVSGIAAGSFWIGEPASGTRASAWISSTGLWNRAATRPTATR